MRSPCERRRFEASAVPELPEMQAHAERLDAAFAGDGARAVHAAGLHRAEDGRAAARRRLRAAARRRVGRRGKYLLLDFEPRDVRRAPDAGRPAKLVDEKQSAKPRGGQARLAFADGAAAAAHRGGHRAPGRRVGASPAIRTSQAPLAGSAPRPTSSTRRRSPSSLAAHPMRLHGFLRDQHRIAGLGRRLANEVCHRAKLSPFATPPSSDADEVAPARRRRSAACIDEALAYERGRDEMSSSKDRPGARAPPRRRAVPGVRRHDPRRRVPPLHRRLLPHLPDGRQGPRRQHDEQVPQVARRGVRSGRAP